MPTRDKAQNAAERLVAAVHESELHCLPYGSQYINARQLVGYYGQGRGIAALQVAVVLGESERLSRVAARHFRDDAARSPTF